MHLSERHARIALLLAVAAATVLWGISFVPAIRLWGYAQSSGLQWVPAFIATPIYLVLVVPALVLAIIGGRRGLIAAGALMLLAAVAALIIFAE